MTEEAMSKERLLQELAAAYERVIEAAKRAEQRGADGQSEWGPREVVAHLAGWEVMANVRVPAVVAGMPPAEFADPRQEQVMNDAINAAIVTMAGDQSLDALCGILRRAYGWTVELLREMDEGQFQPGEYVYERTKGVIEHCQEHIEVHLRSRR